MRRSAWSNEQVPAHMAVPLILWLPASDVAADIDASEVKTASVKCLVHIRAIPESRLQ